MYRKLVPKLVVLQQALYLWEHHTDIWCVLVSIVFFVYLPIAYVTVE